MQTHFCVKCFYLYRRKVEFRNRSNCKVTNLITLFLKTHGIQIVSCRSWQFPTVLSACLLPYVGNANIYYIYEWMNKYPISTLPAIMLHKGDKGVCCGGWEVESWSVSSKWDGFLPPQNVSQPLFVLWSGVNHLTFKHGHQALTSWTQHSRCSTLHCGGCWLLITDVFWFYWGTSGPWNYLIAAFKLMLQIMSCNNVNGVSLLLCTHTSSRLAFLGLGANDFNNQVGIFYYLNGILSSCLKALI